MVHFSPNFPEKSPEDLNFFKFESCSDEKTYFIKKMRSEILWGGNGLEIFFSAKPELLAKF